MFMLKQTHKTNIAGRGENQQIMTGIVHAHPVNIDIW